MTPAEVAEAVRAGDVRVAARLMRDLEDSMPGSVETMRELYAHTGRARIIGLTGAPGAGKSTLVDRLVEKLRAAGRTVGVVAVDPTSPFSGGAILGDRVRMQRHSGDAGVFIRSMATRGALGGLARVTLDVVRVLDAMGYQDILVETVGVGQGEVEISRVADVAVVLMVPGLGDEVQSLKAGLLEIADIFCVNKADRDGSDRLVRELQQAMRLGHDARPHRQGFMAAVVKTVAVKGEGVDDLVTAVDAYLSAPENWAADAPTRRAHAEVQAIVDAEIRSRSRRYLARPGVIADLMERRRDPYGVAAEILSSAADDDGTADRTGDG